MSINAGIRAFAAQPQRVYQRKRRIVHVAVQVGVSCVEAGWVFTYESADCGIIVAGAIIIQAALVVQFPTGVAKAQSTAGVLSSVMLPKLSYVMWFRIVADKLITSRTLPS